MMEILTALAATLCLYEMFTRKVSTDLPIFLAKSIQSLTGKRVKDTHYLIYGWIFLILAMVSIIKGCIKSYLFVFKVPLGVPFPEIFNLCVSPILIFSAISFLCLAVGKTCMILAKENSEKEDSEVE